MKYTNVYVLAVSNKNAHAAMCINFITEVSLALRACVCRKLERTGMGRKMTCKAIVC